MKDIVFRKHPPPPEVQSGEQARLFTIWKPEALCALKYWLAARKYNQYTRSNDSQGNTLMGLIYDYDLGRYPSYRRKERGLLVVWDNSLAIPAQKIVLNSLTIENEYAKWWRDMKMEELNG